MFTHDVKLVDVPELLPNPIFPGSEEHGLTVVAVAGPWVVPVVVDFGFGEVGLVRRQIGADVSTDDDPHALAVDVVQLSVVLRRRPENVAAFVDSMPASSGDDGDGSHQGQDEERRQKFLSGKRQPLAAKISSEKLDLHDEQFLIITAELNSNNCSTFKAYLWLLSPFLIPSTVLVL